MPRKALVFSLYLLTYLSPDVLNRRYTWLAIDVFGWPLSAPRRKEITDFFSLGSQEDMTTFLGRRDTARCSAAETWPKMR